jgi:hypothetical protein
VAGQINGMELHLGMIDDPVKVRGAFPYDPLGRHAAPAYPRRPAPTTRLCACG